MDNKHLSFIGLSSLLLSTQALSYHAEVELSLLDSSLFEIDITGTRAGGSVFLKPLRSSNVPFAEMPFTQKTGQVDLEYYSINWDSELLSSTQNTYSVAGTFILKDWLIGGKFSNFSNETNEFIDDDTGLDTLELTGGLFIARDWLVSLSVVNYSFGEVADDGDETGFRVSSKRFVDLPSGPAFSLTGQFFFIDETSELTLAGDYYFNKRTSVGASIVQTWISSDDEDESASETGLSLYAQHYFNRNLSAKLSYIDNESFLYAINHFTFFEPTWVLSGKFRF